MPDSAYLELLKRCLTGIIYDESAWRIDGVGGPSKLTLSRPLQLVKECYRRMIGRMIQIGRQDRVAIIRKLPFDEAAAEEGRAWPLIGYSMIGMKRLNNVQDCIERVLEEGVPGDLVETGVWRGGCTIFMRAVLKERGAEGRTVWAADSFEGLPPAKGKDALMKDPELSGEDFLKVSLEDVKRNFEKFGLLDAQVKFLKGWFCDTLPSSPIQKIAVLRLDGDMYSSTIDVLNALYPRVSPGGFVIIDDYDWKGCHAAVDEYRAKHKLEAPLVPVDKSGVYWQVESPKPAAAVSR